MKAKQRKVLDHQHEGSEFLAARDRAYLVDDQGLGKTMQAVRACDLVGARAVGVVCPASVTSVWHDEFAVWSLLVETVRVVSYEQAGKLNTEDLDVLIFDEAHYLKNASAGRTKAAFGPRMDGVGGLIERVPRVWALSGTPIPNDVSELYTILLALYPAALLDSRGARMSRFRFQSRYCTSRSDGVGKVKVTGLKKARIPELRSKLAPFLLRRLKERELKDFPELTVSYVSVPTRRLAACDVDASLMAKLRKALASSDPKEELKKLMPVAASLRRVLGEMKAAPVADLLAHELKTGRMDAVVVFAWHRQVVKILEQALAPFGVVTLTGDTPVATRREVVKRFQTDPAVRVFIGNITAAGVGLTLTKACHVAMVESSWRSIDNEQAIDRCHRIGQVRPVSARYFVAADTPDVDVIKVVIAKAKVAAAVLG